MLGIRDAVMQKSQKNSRQREMGFSALASIEASCQPWGAWLACALAGLFHGMELSGVSEPRTRFRETCLGQNKHLSEKWPLVYWGCTRSFVQKIEKPRQEAPPP